MNLLRDIALFVEVAKTGSFTRAAAQLDMPASTLSRRISVLEKEIGLRLFNRTTRRVGLTDVGTTYFARCQHLVEEARIAHEDIGEAVNTAKGTLRLACPVDFARQYLPPILSSFCREHPLVDVELELSSRVDDVASGRYDAALRLGPLPDSNLIAHHLVDLHVTLFAAPAYLRQSPKLEHPDDLSKHECLRFFSDGGVAPWPLLEEGDLKGTPLLPKLPAGRFRANNNGLLHRLAIEGNGIATLELALAQDDVAAGRLVRVLPAWRIVPVPLHLLTPSRLVPARVRLFVEYVAKSLGATWSIPANSRLSET